MNSHSDQTARYLAPGAIFGAVLGVIAWIVIGAARPGYLPLRQLISDLGEGSTAPLMNAAFVLSGLLLLASPLTLVVFVIFVLTGAPGSPLAAFGLSGLLERVLVVEIHAWYVALGYLAVRGSSRSVGLYRPGSPYNALRRALSQTVASPSR